MMTVLLLLLLQPVIVSNCNKYMNMDLWSPESFAKEFGHMENDLVNCNSGTLLVGNQMKVFWDGFENISGTVSTAAIEKNIH